MMDNYIRAFEIPARRVIVSILFVVVLITACTSTPAPAPGQQEAAANASDYLPSWNEGATRKGIVDFVARVSTIDSPDFVPEDERIAVFDNDGTLWAEQPMYFQLAFVIDRVRALAPENPEWANTQPFKAVLEGDLETALGSSDQALLALLVATHSGMTNAEFRQSVSDWIATAKHPTTGRLYTEMVYQPMLELLEFMRANGFQTYIVSGGGIDFMRPWAEQIYGIPPEQVVGTQLELELEFRDGTPVLWRMPEINFINDKAGKPIGISRHIGRRPIAAFGNSDGDLQMLQWTAAGDGPNFCMYVWHTDEAREWAYDRDSHIGRFDEGLDEARARGWAIADMKNDWNTIFPP